jgi:hypothetical protein
MRTVNEFDYLTPSSYLSASSSQLVDSLSLSSEVKDYAPPLLHPPPSSSQRSQTQPRHYSPPAPRPPPHHPPPPQEHLLPPGISPTPPPSTYKIPTSKSHPTNPKPAPATYYPPPTLPPPSFSSSSTPSVISPPSLPPPPLALPPPSLDTTTTATPRDDRPLSPTRRHASPSRYRSGRHDIPYSSSSLSPNKSLRRGSPHLDIHSPQQQRPTKGRIDSNQMPRPKPTRVSYPLPVYHTKSSTTGGRKLPPSYLTEFNTIDCGNCSPRYLRVTTTAPPSSSQLNSELLLPFALTVTPFASPENSEMEVPLVDMLEYGQDTSNPIRCIRCNGYVNPFVQWIDNGNKWKCNLCGVVNMTPTWSALSLSLSLSLCLSLSALSSPPPPP